MSYKKFIAIAMSAVMMFGGSITAFADNSDTDASGTLTGTGTTAESEGYVSTTINKILIPTTDSVNAALAYKIDPQRLIQSTDKAAYEDYSFPAKDADTGVYFLTGTKKYENVSETFWVANKGTGDVTFTITGQLIASADASKDISIGTKAEATAAAPEAAKLYMGMLIGKDPTAAELSTTATSKKVVLAAVPANFKYTYDKDAAAGSKYKYEAIENSTWNGVSIQFEGAVANYATAADATVPKLSLTYAWAAKGDTDATDSGITVDTCGDNGGAAAAATELTTTYDAGAGTFKIAMPSGTTISAASAVTNLKVNGTAITVDINLNSTGDVIKIARSAVKTAMQAGSVWPANATDNLVITFTADGTNYTTTIARQ